MSHNVAVHHVDQYNGNVMFLSQQKSTKFRGFCRIEDLKGKKGSYDQLGPTKPTRRKGRHSDTVLVNTPHYRRWVTAHTWDWADLVDDDDQLKMLYDPTHPYAVNAGMAFARQKDDIILEAAFADTMAGEEGDETILWADQTDQIITEAMDSGGNGLTLEKLILAQEVRGLADIDEDIPWYMGVSPKQISNLFRTTEVKSHDYNEVKALYDGRVDTFMGFKFVKSNRVLSNGSTRRCCAFADKSLLLAEPKSVKTDIGPRRDKNNADQIFVTMNLGAVRMEEVQVIEVQCTEE